MAGSEQGAALDREWLAANPHVAENYSRVCEALGLTPWTIEAPVALGLLDLAPLDDATLAALRGFDAAS